MEKLEIKVQRSSWNKKKIKINKILKNNLVNQLDLKKHKRKAISGIVLNALKNKILLSTDLLGSNNTKTKYQKIIKQIIF